MYGTTCLVSILHSVPSSCALCQPVLIVSTSDMKYGFGVPFKVLTKQVCLHACRNILGFKNLCCLFVMVCLYNCVITYILLPRLPCGGESFWGQTLQVDQIHVAWAWWLLQTHLLRDPEPLLHGGYSQPGLRQQVCVLLATPH